MTPQNANHKHSKYLHNSHQVGLRESNLAQKTWAAKKHKFSMHIRVKQYLEIHTATEIPNNFLQCAINTWPHRNPVSHCPSLLLFASLRVCCIAWLFHFVFVSCLARLICRSLHVVFVGTVVRLLVCLWFILLVWSLVCLISRWTHVLCFLSLVQVISG